MLKNRYIYVPFTKIQHSTKLWYQTVINHKQFMDKSIKIVEIRFEINQ